MSNEVIPVDLINQLALLSSDGLDEDTLAVAGSGSNKRISIKGGVFRKIVNGKEVGAIEDRHMNIIFVKMSHTPSRTYYDKGYKEGAKLAPVCWSTDSKKPDAGVKQPQSDTCDKCQWSVKGTGQNGQGTACRLSWRTAVVIPQDEGGDVMQLVIPAASCFGDEEGGRRPFRSYIQWLASHNISAGRVVTKMSFDTKAPSPRVLFSPVAAITPDVVDTIKAQGTSPAAESAIKMPVYNRDEANTVPVEVPPATPPEADQVVPATIEEPTLRKTDKTPEPPAAERDVSDVIKKWASKKQE